MAPKKTWEDTRTYKLNMLHKKVNKYKIYKNIENVIFQWCTVDAENVFVFQGKEYQISKSLKQYEVYNKAVKLNNGEYNNFSNKAEMDKILVVKINDHLLFYDMNIERIKGKYILKGDVFCIKDIEKCPRKN